jgi:hypothetical protein
LNGLDDLQGDDLLDPGRELERRLEQLAVFRRVDDADVGERGAGLEPVVGVGLRLRRPSARTCDRAGSLAPGVRATTIVAAPSPDFQPPRSTRSALEAVLVFELGERFEVGRRAAR